MKKLMAKTKIVSILLLICFSFISKNSFAKNNDVLDKINFSIGTSYIKFNDHDSRFVYKNNYDEKPLQQFKTLSAGLLVKPYNEENYVFGVFTNRFINSSTIRKATDLKYGVGVDIKQKTYSDSVLLGYKINNFIPGIFISRVNSKKQFIYNGVTQASTNIIAPVFGVYASMFLHKNVSINLLYLRKSKALSMNDSYGMGMSLVF